MSTEILVTGSNKLNLLLVIALPDLASMDIDSKSIMIFSLRWRKNMLMKSYRGGKILMTTLLATSIKMKICFKEPGVCSCSYT